MAVISMKQLLEAGVHFGHQTRKWNPKMKKYIFAARHDIHIIDLELTAKLIEEAYNFVKEEAERCGQFYVNSRWLGGCLTNFKTMRARIDHLEKLERMEKNGEFELLPKKEVLGLKKEMEKLQENLGGIKDMHGMPGLMFIVDPSNEDIAVAEARKLRIPIVAITDTNCDPDEIDYVIPGNDDAIRAVKLISGAMADAVIEGRQGQMGAAEAEAEAAEAAEETEAAAE